ncbi:MAG: hypothetical protein NVS4B3_08150 [Gemmatimonadaceae bacterium]
MASFAQARRVIGEERPVDQLAHVLGTVDPTRIDPLTLQEARRVMRRVLSTMQLTLFSVSFLIRLGSRRRCAFNRRTVPG